MSQYWNYSHPNNFLEVSRLEGSTELDLFFRKELNIVFCIWDSPDERGTAGFKHMKIIS